MLVIAPGREIIDFKVSMRGHLAPIKIKRALHVRQTLDEKVKRRNTLTATFNFVGEPEFLTLSIERFDAQKDPLDNNEERLLLLIGTLD